MPKNLFLEDIEDGRMRETARPKVTPKKQLNQPESEEQFVRYGNRLISKKTLGDRSSFTVNRSFLTK